MCGLPTQSITLHTRLKINRNYFQDYPADICTYCEAVTESLHTSRTYFLLHRYKTVYAVSVRLSRMPMF